MESDLDAQQSNGWLTHRRKLAMWNYMLWVKTNTTTKRMAKKEKKQLTDMRHVINSTGEWKYLCEKPAGLFSLLKLQIQTIQLAL